MRAHQLVSIHFHAAPARELRRRRDDAGFERGDERRNREDRAGDKPRGDKIRLHDAERTTRGKIDDEDRRAVADAADSALTLAIESNAWRNTRGTGLKERDDGQTREQRDRSFRAPGHVRRSKDFAFVKPGDEVKPYG